MPFEVGISSGIMAAAPEEERIMYTGLQRKAYYAITQGVKFVQIDLESISELEEEGLKQKMEEVKKLGIKYGIHSETRAFGVEAAELDSAIETDYKFGHERLGRILELSGELGSEYVLIHSSESTPLRLLGRVLQPSILVDFFGNPLNEFIEHYKFLKDWLIGGKIEDVVEALVEAVRKAEERDMEEITREDVVRAFEERGIKVPNYIWRELLPLGRDFEGYVAEMIRDIIDTAMLRIIGKKPEIEKIRYKDLLPEEKELVKKFLKEELQRKIPEMVKYFLDYIRSRSLHYGPERFAYWAVAKYLEVEEPEWWKKFVRTSIEYFAKVEKKSVEEWCRDNRISLEKLSIDEDSFRELERLWVPAVSAKYIWGHFWQEKNWREVEGKKVMILPDLKKILREKKMVIVLESPMAQRGVEEFLRLAIPLHFYHLCKEIGEDITGIALDFEHIMSLRLQPQVIIDLFPNDGGKLVRVIHAGWPSPLAPAHLPLLLGSDEQFKYYQWLYKLRKKGLGVKNTVYLIYERGAAHIRESIISLRKISEFLEKEIEPDKLPSEFFGIEMKEAASPQRQWQIIREHAFDPLKSLLALPEEEYTWLGEEAKKRGKLAEWKREELK